MSVLAVHIDWLTVSQVHEGAPDFGGDFVVWYDPTTREIKRTQMYGAQILGSWESSCRVRCLNGRVEFSGNPSKWGRLEAVGGGCASLPEALSVASAILQAHELPAFEMRSPIQHEGQWVHRSPRVSRVDLAGCYLLGGPVQTYSYSLWVESQGLGKQGKRMRRVGPESCVGGSARRQMLVVYTKWLELIEAFKHWKRKRVGNVDQAREYLHLLVQIAKLEGWVRRETRLGCDYLCETGLCWPENWSGETMLTEFRKYALAGELSEFGAVTDWRVDARVRLLSLGLSERAASIRLGVLAEWMAGFLVGPGVGLSRPTWYRYVKDLQIACGVDIRQPPNVVTLGVRMQQAARPVQARFATFEDVTRLYADLPQVV